MATSGTIKSLDATFHAEIYSSAAEAFPGYLAWSLDRDYALKRITGEGDRFSCHVLSSFGKAIEKSLVSLEKLEVPLGFNLFKDTSLPVYLNYFTSKLFTGDGIPLYTRESLLSDEEKRITANQLRWLRQILLAFSKVKDVPALQGEEEALATFSLRAQYEPSITAPSWFLTEVRKNIRQVVMDGEELVAPLEQWASEPWGRHGPGAVAEKETAREKWRFNHIPGVDDDLYCWRPSTFEYYGDARPVSRATAVPKDFKGLRIICIEPKEFQFAQQGLMKTLYDVIHASPLTRRAIRFDDQTKSQALCKRLDLVTIDLKDASDTISLRLCRLLFPDKFFRLVTRYRSRFVEIDDVEIKPACFASMGSALCFPIETLVFWAVARACRSYGSRALPIRVFGDDIIVAYADYSDTLKMLGACGFQINPSKTCIRTPIRESCGAWKWFGLDCEIVRFTNLRLHAHTADSLLSWTSCLETCKCLLPFAEGTAVSILDSLDTLFPVPWGYGIIPANLKSRCRTRYNKTLQRMEVEVPVLIPRSGGSTLPGYQGLYAWLVGNDVKPGSSGTTKVVKWRWVDCNFL